MYFDEMLDMEIEYEFPELDEMESTEEIVYYIRDCGEEMLLEWERTQENHPSVSWAMMRLDFLAEKGEYEQEYFVLLVDLFMDKKLLEHLLDVQQRVKEFMDLEKPRLMEAWDIDSEEHSQYRTMMSALREEAIANIVAI